MTLRRQAEKQNSRAVDAAKSPLSSSTRRAFRKEGSSRKYASASSAGTGEPSGRDGTHPGSAAAARASSRRDWPSRSRPMLARATSSSSSGAFVLHSARRCDMMSASSASIRQYAASACPSTSSGSVVSTPASGSSNPVPYAQRASSCASASESYALSECREGSVTAASHVGDVLGDVVERRVAVDLVCGGREVRVLLGRARRRDRVRAYDPDARALVAAGEHVAGVAQCHLVVGGMDRPDVYVVEAALAAYEHLVQRPVCIGHAALSRCLAANTVAASRTHAPSSWACLRWATRSALHGP